MSTTVMDEKKLREAILKLSHLAQRAGTAMGEGTTAYTIAVRDFQNYRDIVFKELHKLCVEYDRMAGQIYNEWGSFSPPPDKIALPE